MKRIKMTIRHPAKTRLAQNTTAPSFARPFKSRTLKRPALFSKSSARQE